MLLTAALAYARHGIPVLPVHTPDPGGGCSCDRGVRCERPGKHPRLRHGLTEASTDPRLIELWWSRWPAANVGLRTGIAMDVADIDSAEGRHGLTHLLGGTLPPGPRVRTGGGGWHLWFRPLGCGNRVRLLPGLDWRGLGGYVVAPPSRHVNGADYRWVRPPAEQLPAGPAALRALIEGPPPYREDDRPAGGATVRSASGHIAIAHPDRYGRAALAAEVERVSCAPVGARNDTLNRAAFALGRLVGAGLLDAGDVVRGLDTAARQAGLGRAEIRGTIRSGLTAGRRVPLGTETNQPSPTTSHHIPTETKTKRPAPTASRRAPTETKTNQPSPTTSHRAPTETETASIEPTPAETGPSATGAIRTGPIGTATAGTTSIKTASIETQRKQRVA